MSLKKHDPHQTEKPNIIPNSAVKVLKNRIVLIMRVNPDVRIVSMVYRNH